MENRRYLRLESKGKYQRRKVKVLKIGKPRSFLRPLFKKSYMWHQGPRKNRKTKRADPFGTALQDFNGFSPLGGDTTFGLGYY